MSELLEKRTPILGGTIDIAETISEDLDTVDAVVAELLEKKAKRSPILGGTIDLEETVSEVSDFKNSMVDPQPADDFEQELDTIDAVVSELLEKRKALLGGVSLILSLARMTTLTVASDH